MSITTPDPSAMTHLYRGELGRMTAYRIRLDTTTNWALGASVAEVTFTLGTPSAPHVVILLPAALSMVFAVLESRRLQDLELIRERVRFLERGFISEQLGASPMDDWYGRLVESVKRPRAPISLLDALAVRVRRNYIWLLLCLYGSWWVKLSLASEPVVDAASVGPIPGWLSIVVATALLAPAIVLAFRAKPLLPG
jgi:uncharacterized membrane protein